MSRREIWFAEDVLRLREILSDSQSDPVEDLGIGFFSATRSAPPEPGILVKVCPSFLHEALLTAVGKGFVSPLSHEVVFLGEGSVSDVLSISRWLMLGIQGTRIEQGDGLDPLFREWPEVAEAQSVQEVVRALLGGIHRKVLELRAGRVVFIAALSWLWELARTVGIQRGFAVPPEGFSLVRREFVTWMTEEFLHPNLIILPENASDFGEFIQLSKGLALSSGTHSVLKL